MATITSNGTGGGLASLGASWAGGVAPVADVDKVIIAATDIIEIDGVYSWGDDTTTALTVTGRLKFSRTVTTDLTIRGGLVITDATTAVFDMGTVASPILCGGSATAARSAGITATLRLNKSAVLVLNKYGISVGFRSSFFQNGDVTAHRGNIMTAGISAGATSAVIDNITGWRVGDNLVFTQTTGVYQQEDVRTIVTITPGAGTTGTVTFAATTYAHALGCPVGNFTRTVTITSFNTAFHGTFNMNGNATSVVGSRDIRYAAWHYLSNGANHLNGNHTRGTYVKLIGLSFYRGRGTLFQVNSGNYEVPLEQFVFYSTNADVGSMVYFQSGASLTADDWLNCSTLYASITSANSQGGQGIIINRIYIAACERFAQIGVGIAFEINDSYFHSCTTATDTTSFGVGGPTNVNRSFIGSSELPGTPSVNVNARLTQQGTTGTNIMNPTTFTDCKILAYPAGHVNTVNYNAQSTVDFVNKNTDVAAQESYTWSGEIIRDNSFIYRSTSSHKFSPKTAGRPHIKVFKVLAPNNTLRRVTGYIYYDATYGVTTPPTVTLSGLGITPQIFTAGGTAATWYKFDLSATQTSGAAGNLSLTVSGQSAAITGNFWLSGITDVPFVGDSRDYGYEFNAQNFRTVNPIITESVEATVGAYTGITINHGTSTITVTSNHSIQEIYDYCYWELCQTANLEKAEFFTSTDGVNFTSTYDLVVNGGNITGAGAITLGAGVFTRTGSETSGLDITYNSGANVFTNVVVSGFVINSRVRVYNSTDSVELYNADVAATSVTIPVIWSADKTLDLRVTLVNGLTAYLPYQSTGTLENTGSSFTATQTLDTVYNTNAINGSLVTDFATDFPNVQIDINDPDGETTAQRLYAWFQFATHSSQGIVTYFNGIIAQDSINYKITVSIVDLLLENTHVSGLPAKITGAYLYRDDGSTVILSTSKSIQLDPSKAYIANADSVTASLAVIANKVDDNQALIISK